MNSLIISLIYIFNKSILVMCSILGDGDTVGAQQSPHAHMDSIMMCKTDSCPMKKYIYTVRSAIKNTEAL